jgi:hypothetical protein
MQVTDITNLVIERVAKKYNIKEDDVSWHKIAIELAYMYKKTQEPFSHLDNILTKENKERYINIVNGKNAVDINKIEVIDPFQISLLDQIEEKQVKSVKKEKLGIIVPTYEELVEVGNRIFNEPKFSKDVLNCYRVCLDYFPEHLHPKRESIVKSWYSTIDKLNRIDKVPFSEIERITKLAREDEFTSKNIFHSLTKLRKKPKGEDIYWIVKWSEKFKPKTKTVNRQSEETIKKNIDGW